MSTSRDEAPQIIWPPVKLNEPNETIPIYEGEVELRTQKKTYKVDSVVEFKWFPRPRPVITGFIKLDAPTMQLDEYELTAYVDNLKFGDCFAVDVQYSTSHPNSLKLFGFLHGDVTMGDITISVEYIDFSIPNLRYIRGESVSYETEEGEKGWTIGRTIFTTETHEITIDAIPKCDQRVKSLRGVGGYDISYGGRIKKLKGAISYSESKDILEAFGVFLSFVNGSQVNTLFHRGVFGGKTTWQ